MSNSLSPVASASEVDGTPPSHPQENLLAAPTSPLYPWEALTSTNQINGRVPLKSWFSRSPDGSKGAYGSEWRERPAIDYFYMMFPMEHLPRILRMTNTALGRAKHGLTTASEILGFFGVLILMSRYEFGGTRRNLWRKESDRKYMVAPNFGRAMTRRRFDAIFSGISFNNQPMETGAMTSVQHRWALVNDFLNAINDHREKQFSPSDTICVDESMVRWYGLGGHWIDIGLSFYSAIDRKPESSCELKTAACAKSGIMIRLELVTTA